MELLKEMADAFILLIRVGAVLRVVFCFIHLGIDEEQSASYKKKMKNAVVFYVLAESIWQIKDLVMSYYM
ncbi:MULTISPECIES: mercury transporter [Clostridia]|uniref:Mercury transporter n=1 Tax=Fusibacter ferrireducens TaxID=2785058 RepID=A0ABR9ZPE8_9FIRM|nr:MULTISPECIES: mercury transporter [Eubacteriales incertae sedis]MBF4692289.1 mercury transporter [Fusibacter ferrireducens]WRR93845.1 mercury transporter [Sinanaerobacter sp. ZZT-01]